MGMWNCKNVLLSIFFVWWWGGGKGEQDMLGTHCLNFGKKIPDFHIIIRAGDLLCVATINAVQSTMPLTILQIHSPFSKALLLTTTNSRTKMSFEDQENWLLCPGETAFEEF